ncbi:MAG: PIN domain nuclease [Nitrospirae bacterium]|nr:PIN domain nuclease [Nitrospirota bacterium]
MASEELVLVDTSVWIESFRTDGDERIRRHLAELILTDRAAWCEIVIIELLNGIRSEMETKKLKEYIEEIHKLPITDGVWAEGRKLIQRCRMKGYTIPVTDIVIASCALYHNVSLEYRDRHFDYIFKEVL